MEQATFDLPDVDRRRWAVDLNDLCREIGKRHQIRVARDDPALVVVTGLEIVARKMLSEFEGSIQRSNDDMSALMAQHMEMAKGVGVGLVEASAEYHVKKLTEATQRLAPAVAQEARTLIQGLAGEIGIAQQSLLRTERRAWTAAALSAGCLLLTVGLIIGRVL